MSLAPLDRIRLLGAGETMDNTHETALVVDDNIGNRELVVDLLAVVGVDSVEAGSGEEAVALCRDVQPDIVVMDIGLPEMDGIEATRLIKSDARTKHIPVVAVTAHALVVDEEAARAAGCCGYITKPIDTRSFVAGIRDTLDRSQRSESELGG